MADITKDELKGAVTEIVNPNETTQQFYTDGKDKSIIAEALAPLKPLEKSMRNALNRRGINASGMSFENLVMSFYNEFVLAKNDEKMAITFLSEHPLQSVTTNSLNNADHSDAEAVVAMANKVGTITTGVLGLAKNVRDKAKAKKAKQIADGGGYSTLTPYQKSLLQTYYNVPVTGEELALGNDIDKDISKLEKKEAGESPVSKDSIKKIIIGVVIVAVVIAIGWFFMKKKK